MHFHFSGCIGDFIKIFLTTTLHWYKLTKITIEPVKQLSRSQPISSSPGRRTKKFAYLFIGEPKGQRPRCHSEPTGNKTFVQSEKAFVFNCRRQALPRTLVEKAATLCVCGLVHHAGFDHICWSSHNGTDEAKKRRRFFGGQKN